MSLGRGLGARLAQGMAPPCSKTVEVDDVIVVTVESTLKEVTQDSRARCRAATRTAAGTEALVGVQGTPPTPTWEGHAL